MSLKYWVWLSSKTELKPEARYKLLDAFGSPEAVFHADERSVREKLELSPAEMAVIADKSLGRADLILEKCHEGEITILALTDAPYPERLRNIYDPPVVLYIKGRIPAIDEQAAVAVVGTRSATAYGIKMARSIGYDLTRGGALVVTGLASGADSAAAEGALRAGGSCIGVLGCAIDWVYPRNNDALYNDVAAVGALVSEYPPGAEIHPRFFPERNRIMSGLSVGALIIEAPARSGALITASRALEQGRDVYAVPGNADAPNSAGTNGLIREGAALVQSAWDILSDLKARFPEKITEPYRVKSEETRNAEDSAVYQSAVPAKTEKAPARTETGRGFLKLRVRNERKKVDKTEPPEYIDLQKQLSALTQSQLAIVSAIDEPSKHIDDIIEKTSLAAATVLSELTLLEIKGFVIQEGGKRFSLSIRSASQR